MKKYSQEEIEKFTTENIEIVDDNQYEVLVELFDNDDEQGQMINISKESIADINNIEVQQAVYITFRTETTDDAEEETPMLIGGDEDYCFSEEEILIYLKNR